MESAVLNLLNLLKKKGQMIRGPEVELPYQLEGTHASSRLGHHT